MAKGMEMPRMRRMGMRKMITPRKPRRRAGMAKRLPKWKPRLRKKSPEKRGSDFAAGGAGDDRVGTLARSASMRRFVNGTSKIHFCLLGDGVGVEERERRNPASIRTLIVRLIHGLRCTRDSVLGRFLMKGDQDAAIYRTHSLRVPRNVSSHLGKSNLSLVHVGKDWRCQATGSPPRNGS